MLVVIADTTQLGKQFHVFTTLLVKTNFCRSYFACCSPYDCHNN